MSKYRKVETRIWLDDKFTDLSDDGKLTFLLLLTHPNMTSLGAMRATPGSLADDLGWLTERLGLSLQEVLAAGLAEHDPRGRLIALPNFIRYNPPESPNVVKAWAGALDMLPDCGLKILTIQRAVAYAETRSKGFAKALPEAFAKVLAKSMPNQEQEPEQEQEQETIPSPIQGVEEATPSLRVVGS